MGATAPSDLITSEAGPGTGSTASRPDSRTDWQIRTLLCERGLLQRADGSARWSQDKTSVVAAVYGPRSTFGRKEDSEQAVVEVFFKPNAGLYRFSAPGRVENQYQKCIRKAVQGVFAASMHPRTAVQVTIQVVRDDGAMLPCALNATCAALVDAGILLRSMFAAVSVTMTKSGEFLLDPTQQEEQEGLATATFAFPTSGKSEGPDKKLGMSQSVLMSDTQGAVEIQQYLAMMQLARQGCQRITEFTKMSLDKVFC